jgi:hypothetical protein
MSMTLNNLFPWKKKKESQLNKWSVIGGASLLLAGVAAVVGFSDLKRYIKISTM